MLSVEWRKTVDAVPVVHSNACSAAVAAVTVVLLLMHPLF